MRDRPAKQALYIVLILLAVGVAFVNPWHIEIAVPAAGICVMFVAMYIHSNRKREREKQRQREFPVIPVRKDG